MTRSTLRNPNRLCRCGHANYQHGYIGAWHWCSGAGSAQEVVAVVTIRNAPATISAQRPICKCERWDRDRRKATAS